MSEPHRYYEQQYAAALIGVLSDGEILELERHAKDCAECRQQFTELRRVDEMLFVSQPICSSQPHASRRELHERFLARAAREGVSLSQGVPLRLAGSSSHLPLGLVAALFILLIFIACHLKPQLPLAAAVPRVSQTEPSIPVANARPRAVEASVAGSLQHSLRIRKKSPTVSYSRAGTPPGLDFAHLGPSFSLTRSPLRFERPETMPLRFGFHPLPLIAELSGAAVSRTEPDRSPLRFICDVEALSSGTPLLSRIAYWPRASLPNAYSAPMAHRFPVHASFPPAAERIRGSF